MQLKFLKLIGWRNYNRQEFSPSPGINLIVGGNGQGKTNLLEAVYFLSTGFSPRVARTEQLINWRGEYLFVSATATRKTDTVKVEMGLHRDGRRVNKLNGAAVRRLADVGGSICSVLFVPEDLELVKGSPAQRRRFADLELTQLDANYRSALEQYRQVLQQRNALLKQHNIDNMLLKVLTAKLIRLGEFVTHKRSDFVDRLSLLTRLRHRLLSGNKEELSLRYIPSLAPPWEYSNLEAQYGDVERREIWQGTTLLGPHRDDIRFLLDGNDLRDYGSQGQQRTAVLAVKLAEIELFQALVGETPLLLLDDVFSELDSNRCRILLDFLSSGIQTIITATESLPEAKPNKVFAVKNGQVRELIKG